MPPPDLNLAVEVIVKNNSFHVTVIFLNMACFQYVRMVSMRTINVLSNYLQIPLFQHEGKFCSSRLYDWYDHIYIFFFQKTDVVAEKIRNKIGNAINGLDWSTAPKEITFHLWPLIVKRLAVKTVIFTLYTIPSAIRMNKWINE